jgi:hypothetical protein
MNIVQPQFYLICYLLVFCELLSLNSLSDVVFIIICCNMLLLCWVGSMFLT